MLKSIKWSKNRLLYIEGTGADTSSNDYNPWPYYHYTGQLRPYKRDPRREVPDHIKRPDYAVTGIPVSEQAVRDSSQIKVLDDEEIEGMRVACKV